MLELAITFTPNSPTTIVTEFGAVVNVYTFSVIRIMHVPPPYISNSWHEELSISLLEKTSHGCGFLKWVGIPH